MSKEGRGRIKRSCSFSGWWHMYHNRISLTHSTTTWRKQFYNLALRQGTNISLWISTQKHTIIAIKENADVIYSCKDVESNYNSMLATESVFFLKRCPAIHVPESNPVSDIVSKVKTHTFFSSSKSGCKYLPLSKKCSIIKECNRTGL